MKIDKFGRPYLIWTYHNLTSEEKLNHFESVGKALLKHKYIYYILLDELKMIADAEYDYIERYYEAIAEDLGLEPEIVNMVGFNENHRWAKKAIEEALEYHIITSKKKK